MSDLNTLTIQGRIVKDTELKTTEKGVKFASFSIAVNSQYKKENGEWASNVDFFPLSIFGEFANSYAPKLTKGRYVIVEGKLKQSKWQQECKEKTSTSIVVSKLHLLPESKEKVSETEYFEQIEYDYTEGLY